MVIIALLVSFSLNLINHGNILIGILNAFLFLLSVYCYYLFSHQSSTFLKFQNRVSPLIILVGATPLFTGANDVFNLAIAIGIDLLLIFYLTKRFKKILGVIVIICLVLAGFYSNGLIKPPNSIQTNLLFFNDDWTNLFINQMKTESMYMPYLIRSVLFNPSVYLYVMLSKITDFFTLKNLSDVLLIANIYPLVKGVTLDLKNWDKEKKLVLFLILLTSLSMVTSRSIEIINVFILMSPFLMYYILRGIDSLNTKIYLILFALSIFIAYGP